MPLDVFVAELRAKTRRPDNRMSQEELRQHATRHFTVTLDPHERITLHNAVVKLYNAKKPKNVRDSEWTMERVGYYRLMMKLKKPEDPARQKYEQEHPGVFDL